jgi:hypothetical protein
MPRYKISDRIPQDILDRASICLGVAYPFHLLFPSRFATDEQFAEDLKRRLKAIPYPYQLTRAQRPSTYDVLRKRIVLDSLFQPAVINYLRLCVDEQWFKIRHLYEASTRDGKKFRKFHVPFAKDLARHVNLLRKLVASYELAEEWIGPYVRTVEERLMFESVLLRTCIEEKQQSDTEATRNSVGWIYSAVARSLKTATSKHHALSCHVTSIICSPNCTTTKALSPTPESVRKLIERNPVNKKTKSSD